MKTKIEEVKENLIKIFRTQNEGLLPDEAERRANVALEYYSEIKEAEFMIVNQ
jgi:hypothetical protein